MNTWLSVRTLTQTGKTVKKVRRKKSSPSLVIRSMRLGKKITMGAVKLAALIFIGRL